MSIGAQNLRRARAQQPPQTSRSRRQGPWSRSLGPAGARLERILTVQFSASGDAAPRGGGPSTRIELSGEGIERKLKIWPKGRLGYRDGPSVAASGASAPPFRRSLSRPPRVRLEVTGPCFSFALREGSKRRTLIVGRPAGANKTVTLRKMSFVCH